MQCDDKCGLTQETRTAHCATVDGTTYPDEKCEEAKKPELTRECENPTSCDYQWFASQWSEVRRFVDKKRLTHFNSIHEACLMH